MHEKISQTVKESNNLSKSKSFTDLITGKKETEFPELNSFNLIDSNDSIVESILDYKISAKYLISKNKLAIIKTFSDVLVYTTYANVFNILCGNNHISCKIKDKIADIFVCKFDSILLFIQTCNKTLVYKILDHGKIVKFCEIKYSLKNLVQIKNERLIIGYTEDDNLFKIFGFKYLKNDFNCTEIINYNVKPDDLKIQRLFHLENGLHFNRLNVLINVFGTGPAIFGDEAYNVQEGLLICDYINNKTVVRYIENLNESKLKLKNYYFKIVHDDIIIFYNNNKIIFITIANKKLKIVKQIEFHHEEFDIINLAVSLQNKKIEIIHLLCEKNNIIRSSDEIFKTKNDALKSSDESLKTKNEAINFQDESLKSKIEAMNLFDESLKTKNEVIKSSNESLKTKNVAINFQDESLKSKIEAMNLFDESLNNLLPSSKQNILTPENKDKINMDNENVNYNERYPQNDDQEKKCDFENIKLAIQNEIKGSFSEPTSLKNSSLEDDHLKSSFSKELNKLNKKIDSFYLKVEKDRIQAEQENKIKFKKLLETISSHLNEKLIGSIEATIKKEVKTGILQIKRAVSDGLQSVESKTSELLNAMPSGQFELSNIGLSSELLKIFQITLNDNILPVVESCFEEMKTQMLDEIKNQNEMKISNPTGVTIPLKDEILNLLNEEKVIEAASLALDSEDEILLCFIENMNINLIEKLNFESQNALLKTCALVYEQIKHEELCRFICNILMAIELHDLNTFDLNQINDTLCYIDKIEWKENEKMKLMINMQKNQVKRTLNKRK